MAASTDFNYDDILSLSRAKILDRRRRSYLGSTELLISYGEINAAQKEECIKWLYDNRRIITNPTIGFSNFVGNWVCTDTKYDDERKQILQSFLDVMQSAPIAASTTVWRLLESPLENSGAQNVVLEASYVDPLYLQSVLEDVSSDPYDGSINTINSGVLSGKWYNVKRVADTDQNTGLTRVLWFLRKHNNDDMIFPYYANESELRAEFVKLYCPPDGVETFKTTYYFDSNGNFYVSTNGSTYTAKNGSSATGTLPEEAALLTDAVANRVVFNLTPSPDKETGEVDIRVSMAWFSDSDEKWTIFQGGYGETRTTVLLDFATEERRDDFVQHTYIAPDGHGYYSEDGNNYTRKDGEDSSGILPADAKGLDTVVEGRQLEMRTQQDFTTRRWTVMLDAKYLSADTRCSYIGTDTRFSYKATGTASITIDQAYNVTHAQLATAMAYYNTTPSDGTFRQIGQPIRDQGTGLYSYEAIEVANSAVTSIFRIGPEVVYIGVNSTKKPTTDIDLFNADTGISTDATDPTSDNYYLLGGVYSGGVWTCSIDGTSSIFGYPSFNSDNNTWSWQIRHVSEPEDSIGAEDPLTESSTDFIFESGDEQDFTRFVRRVTMQDIELGALSFKSRFENIPANTFGTHPALANRRKVIPFVRNERILDGKLSYDVWEQVLTPDINDNDEWFYMGATESLDRQKENLVGETIDASNNNKYDTSTLSIFTEILDKSQVTDNGSNQVTGIVNVSEIDDISTAHPVLMRLQRASKQRRTVERWRKYWLRRPTNTDLSNSYDSDLVTIKAAWDAVRNEQTAGVSPSASEATTFDVVKVPGGWAIEKMVVRIDDQIYVDTDAFDHNFDSTGEPICGLSALLLHADPDASITDVFTDTTEA